LETKLQTVIAELVSESKKLLIKYIFHMQNDSFKKTIKLSLEIKKIYDEINKKNDHKKWKVADYTMGMVGDCGDLSKLIMAKNELRESKSPNIDESIEHELVDILWSLIAISDELNIDLESASILQLEKLKSAVEKQIQTLNYN
jgi:NTP pyrophosphatase (non-canonical NTP hydrolase)